MNLHNCVGARRACVRECARDSHPRQCVCGLPGRYTDPWSEAVTVETKQATWDLTLVRTHTHTHTHATHTNTHTHTHTC